MALNRYAPLELCANRVLKVLTLDLTTAYLIANIGKWRTRIDNIAHMNLVKKLTPLKMFTTMLFNVASGHWVPLADPFAGVTKNMNRIERTPLESLQKAYFTVVPIYVFEMGEVLSVLQDSIDARDYSTASNEVAKLVKLFEENVKEVPKMVTDYVEKLPCIKDYCSVRHTKVGTPDEPLKSVVKFRQKTQEHQVTSTLGYFLQYADTGKPLMEWKKPKPDMD